MAETMSIRSAVPVGLVAVRQHPGVETPGYCRVVPLGRTQADGAQQQTGRVVSALCADAFEPQARRYIRTPNSAWATDSFPEFILGWTIGAIGV